MQISRTLDGGGFALLAEVDPPKGAILEPFLDGAAAIANRVTAVAVTDCAHAIMRMTPLAPCRFLVERGIKPVMVINGRDRNRLSFQGDLLAAHALGVRDLLLREGSDPSIGDQPMVRRCGDLGLDTMLQCASAFRAGRDLGGEPLDAACGFNVGVCLNMSNDVAANERTTVGFRRFAGQGARFVVMDSAYDLDTLHRFTEAAGAAGLLLFTSVMLLKSLAMIRYLNNLPDVPHVPDQILKRMMKAPDKVMCGMELASEFIRNARPLCDGALLVSLGWESRLPEFLDLLDVSNDRR